VYIYNHIHSRVNSSFLFYKINLIEKGAESLWRANPSISFFDIGKLYSQEGAYIIGKIKCTQVDFNRENGSLVLECFNARVHLWNLTFSVENCSKCVDKGVILLRGANM